MQRDLFERAPIPKAYVKLAMPVVMAMVVSVVYNMVDTWFISMTGDTRLIAGVSLCAPIFILAIAIGDIWGPGGGSLISRLLGQRRDAEAGDVSSLCAYAALGCGALFMALLLAFEGPILRLLGATEETLPHASAYYRYIALGTPFIVFSMIPNNQLRAEGLASVGMWGAIIGSAVNVTLDPLFIFTLKMGAAGAALATSISNLLTCAIYTWAILKRCKVLTLQPGRARGAVRAVGTILSVGVPASVTNIMSSLSIMLTNRFLLPYGSDKIAAMGIAMKVNMIAQMVLIGFAFGGQPLFGYAYGAKDRARFHGAVRFAFGLQLALGAVFGAALAIAARPLMNAFVADEAVVAAGAEMLRYMQAGVLFMGVALVATSLCQSVGSGAGALILSVSRQGVLFVAMLAALPAVFGYAGILLAQPAANALTAALALVILARIRRGFDGAESRI